MEEFSFDLANLLSAEEEAKLFEEKSTDTENENDEASEDIEKNEDNAEGDDVNQTSEKVGEDKEKTDGDTARKEGDGSSPDTFFSSIASALKKDGILSGFEDSEIAGVKTPEDFAELFEKTIEARAKERIDERVNRVNRLLDGGVEPEAIKKFEETIEYLDGINEDALSAEGDAGENLRKSLIYNDLISRGYSKEKAIREVEKSFKSASDIEDAKDALAALKQHYTDKYNTLQEDVKKREEEAKNKQKQDAEKFKKMILEDELKFGDNTLDKKTRQKVYDAVMRPVHKDEESGQYLTQVQKFQKEKPLEFLKQLGLWFVLTDGGTNPSGLISGQIKAERNKNVRELEQKINSTAFNSDGTLKYSGSQYGDGDVLLDDGWKVGW